MGKKARGRPGAGQGQGGGSGSGSGVSRSQDDVNTIKERGNELFEREDWSGAMRVYEDALKIMPNDPEIHYKFAECHNRDPTSKARPDLVITHCNQAIALQADYSAARVLRSSLYMFMVNDLCNKVMKDMESVLKVKPDEIDALNILQQWDTIVEDFRRCCPSPSLPKPMPVADATTVPIENSSNNKNLLPRVIFRCLTRSSRYLNDQSEPIIPPDRKLKLVYEHDKGHDTRYAWMPVNCSLKVLRDVVGEHFPLLKAVQIKYEDSDGDSVAITCSADLKQVESKVDKLNTFPAMLKLYILEASSGQEHFLPDEEEKIEGCKKVEIDNWLFEFAQLFKTHAGFAPNRCIDLLHKRTEEFISQAFEETVTSERAQSLFDEAALEFEEVAALALFNLGNIHMCAANRRMPLDELADKETIDKQLDDAYNWSKGKCALAKEKYKYALLLNPYLFEALLALGQQELEMATLHCSFILRKQSHLSKWNDLTKESICLFDKAKTTIESAAATWKKHEQLKREKKQLGRSAQGDDSGIGETTPEEKEEEEQAAVMLSQISLLLGNVLFERSQIECRRGSSSIWVKNLEDAVEQFKLAGASKAQTLTFLKNHYAYESMAITISSALETHYPDV